MLMGEVLSCAMRNIRQTASGLPMLRSFSFAFRTWSVMDRAFSFGSRFDQAGLHTPLSVIAKVSRKIKKSPSKDLFYLITMHRF